MEFGSGGGGGSANGIGIRGAGIQGQGLSTTQPVMSGTNVGTGTSSATAGGGTFLNTLPIALTNSDRTTLSQLKARQRIVEKQQSGKKQILQFYNRTILQSMWAHPSY